MPALHDIPIEYVQKTIPLCALPKEEIKNTIFHQAQVKATLSANAEMIAMYRDIGRMIYDFVD